MYKAIFVVIILGLASACAVRERTVVEKPVTPASPATVVVTDPPASTVYVPAR